MLFNEIHFQDVEEKRVEFDDRSLLADDLDSFIAGVVGDTFFGFQFLFACSHELGYFCLYVSSFLFAEKPFNYWHEIYSSDFVDGCAAFPDIKPNIMDCFYGQLLEKTEEEIGNLRGVYFIVWSIFGVYI